MRRGMTLLELILALSLSAVLLAIMGAALKSTIDSSIGGRGDVEQMRVVQGVIAMVTDDLKGAAVVETLDTSGAMKLAEAAAGFNVDSIDTETLGAAAGGSGAGGGGTGDQASSAFPPRRVLGVHGGIDFIEIDVLREKPQLMLDEQGMVAATAALGGIYTVRYALGQGVATLGTPHSVIENRDDSGLVRLEINRDMYNWAEQTGKISDVVGEPLLVAAEVDRIEFRYYDGFEYYESWDPGMQGPWPVAIEIRMWFTHLDKNGEVARHHEERPYIMTVALPMAWNPSDLMVPPTGSMGGSTGAPSASSSGGTQ